MPNREPMTAAAPNVCRLSDRADRCARDGGLQRGWHVHPSSLGRSRCMHPLPLQSTALHQTRTHLLGEERMTGGSIGDRNWLHLPTM